MDIIGTSGNDTLNGTSGDDVIVLGGGIDTLLADAGNDEVIIEAPVGEGSSLDGGLGFDTLVARSLPGFPSNAGPNTWGYIVSYPTIVTGFEALRFESAANAQLYIALLHPVITSGMTNITGGAGSDILLDLVFAPGTYTMPEFTLSNWTNDINDPNVDYVSLYVVPSATADFTLIAREGLASVQSLFGSQGNDILIGSSGSEILTASGGNDQLYGNGGADRLVADNLTPYGATASVRSYAGTVFDGGDGIDVLQAGGAVDLTGATIANFEELSLLGSFAAPGLGGSGRAPSSVTMTADQFVAGFVASPLLSGTGSLTVQLGLGQTFNASAWQFAAEADVEVTFVGTTGNETITGTTGDDVILPGGGVDVIRADAGNDEIVISAPVGTNSVLDGGAGFDTLVLTPQDAIPYFNGGTQTEYQITWPSQLVSLEAVRFDSRAGDFLDLVVLEFQRQNAGLTTVIGGEGRDILYSVVFSAGSYTMPELTFDNWNADLLSPNNDFVVLVVNTGNTDNFVLNARDGLASIQGLRGALGSDILNGSSGSDSLDGGGGINQLYGNGGDDWLFAENYTPYGGSPATNTFAGNTFDGGADYDTLLVGGPVNFQGTFSNIENIYFQPARPAPATGFSGLDAAYLTITADVAAGLPGNLNLGGTGTLEINLAAGQSFSAGGYTASPTANVSVILNGAGGNEWIQGTGRNDTINGGDGDDTLEGGLGDDIISGGVGTDTATYAGLAGGVVVNLHNSAQQDTGTGGFDTLTGIENLVGTDHNDWLSGEGGVNTVYGGGGDDFLDGGGSNDLLDGGTGNDTLWGGGGIDTLVGGEGTDTAQVFGASSDYSLTYLGDGTWQLVDLNLADNDEETDLLVGIERVQFLGDNVTINLLAPNGTSGIDVIFGTDESDAISGLGGDDQLRGNGGNDLVYGGDGNDFVNGGNGDDLIDGGAGIDRAGYYVTDPLLGGITVSLLLQGTAQDVGSQGWDTLVGIENVSGTPFADVLTGDAQNNWLWGSSSWIGSAQSLANNDTIDGGDGDDLIQVGFGNHVLTGGIGNDTLLYGENGSAEVGIVVSLAQGAAQDTGAGSWTLSGFENVTAGSGNDQLTGDSAANTLIGLGGNDILRGSTGADILSGGAGGDQLYGANNGNSAGLIGDEADYLDGGDGDDLLRGANGDDTLLGGAGNDNLRGDDGADVIDGGDGDDFVSYVLSDLAGPVFMDMRGLTNSALPQQIDDGRGTFDSVSNVERVGVSGTGMDDTIFGSISLGNQLFGNDGNDFIRGGNADDRLGGDDGFGAADGNDDIRGNGGADLITGGAGNDILYGGFNSQPTQPQAGDLGDTIDGGLGDDLIRGGDGDDTLLGGEGNDNLRGDDGNDIMDGGGGNDFVSYRWDDLTTGLTIDFSTVHGGPDTQQVGDHRGGNDTVSNIEKIGMFGSQGNDVLIGALELANQIGGYLGDDQIVGGNLDDLLSGEDGNDQIDGGGGFDTASFISYVGAAAYGNAADFEITELAPGQWQVTVLNLADGDLGTDILENIEQMLICTES